MKRKQERKRRRDDRIREFVGYFPRAIRWIPWLIISLCLLLLYPVRTFLDMMFFSLFFSHHRIIGSVEARDYKNDLKKQQKAANEQQAVNALIRAKHAQIEQDKASSLLAHELDLVREINDDFF